MNLHLLAVAGLLVAGGAWAQNPPAAPGGTPAQALADDPAVRQSQDPMPTPQGTRSPEVTSTPTGTSELQALLDQVWQQPVDLQGNPVAPAAALAQPSPAAATATGCDATSHDLAARPGASPAPCPPEGREAPRAP